MSVAAFTWVLAAVSLAATWLNARRLRLCFLLWVATNLCWCYVNLAIGLHARAALDATYSLLALYGWR